MSTPASSRSSARLPAEARRQQILDVTAEILAARGFSGLSIQSVAQAAGVSRPIVYEHFGDLGGLLEALVDREMQRAGEQISSRAQNDPGSGDPRELMLQSLRIYLEAVEEHPSTWRLVLMPPEGAPESLRGSISRGRATVLEGLREAVGQGVRPGEPTEDPDMTARTLSAIADEYARLVLIDPARFPPQRLNDHARWFLGQLRP